MFSIVYFCCLRVVWRNKVNSFEIIVGTIMISAMDATDVEEHWRKRPAYTSVLFV